MVPSASSAQDGRYHLSALMLRVCGGNNNSYKPSECSVLKLTAHARSPGAFLGSIQSCRWNFGTS